MTRDKASGFINPHIRKEKYFIEVGHIGRKFGDNSPHTSGFTRSWLSDRLISSPGLRVRHTRQAKRVAALTSEGPAAAGSGVARSSFIPCVCEFQQMPARCVAPAAFLPAVTPPGSAKTLFLGCADDGCFDDVAHSGGVWKSRGNS
ncbi:hypothetical protein TIFTF001_037986 [Ficus carica]|uniref:Uncharacterized protein n=1 Tax=Ficus carica TaxID=3494 RepID=A0AA88JCN5_FICCA|nr:hypothetical protein TIFTF001_037982 [Ficus carica]GMN68935.1 hypothetical protein TIFTF001_037986 [Ficus carica]